MKIGLIDVDGHNFPNLPLMKLSSYHKSKGDSVEWYEPLFSGHMDIVYMSKVFSFMPDYQYFVDADAVIKGGTGYFYPSGGEKLPDEIEYIYPDYSIYFDKIPEVRNTAYGFLTRGLGVYVLCNFNTSFEQDLERIYILRDLGYNPFVMLYNKESIPKGYRLKHLQRWVNNRIVFRTCERFEDFDTRK